MSPTLSIDCGGTGIKACVVGPGGSAYAEPLREPTPYPLPPARFVATLAAIRERMPRAERVTVGMPGMIRHGVVVTTPHYVTRRGPRSRVDPALQALWAGFDAGAALREALGVPVMVLNDAEIHGAGVVTGTGFELVLTLGTGLGCAAFDSGALAPHLELSHAPTRWGLTWDTYVGDKERRRLGDALWSRRVRRMLEDLRPVFVWDRVYLGGGNSARIAPRALAAMGDDVEIVPNSAALVGGARAWSLLGGRA